MAVGIILGDIITMDTEDTEVMDLMTIMAMAVITDTDIHMIIMDMVMDMVMDTTIIGVEAAGMVILLKHPIQVITKQVVDLQATSL
jgi:hypothetical protein